MNETRKHAENTATFQHAILLAIKRFCAVQFDSTLLFVRFVMGAEEEHLRRSGRSAEDATSTSVYFGCKTVVYT